MIKLTTIAIASTQSSRKFTNSNITPNIRGINIRSLLPISSSKLKAFKDFAYQYGRYLKLDYNTAKALLFGKNAKRIEFFKQIATRYNEQQYKRSTEPESTQFALDIFKRIKNPHKEHFFIINNYSGSFEMLGKIFELANDKKSLQFVYNFKNQYKGIKHKTKVLTDMLKSPNKENYMAYPDDYISYLKIHADDENAIVRLDKLIEEGKYSTAKYEVIYNYHQFKKHDFVGSGKVLNAQTLIENYSPEGMHILKRFLYDYTYLGEKLKDNDFKEILKIYNTTTTKNEKLRDDILHLFMYSADNKKANNIEHNEIVAIRELFEAADSDKHVFSFLQKCYKEGIKLEYAQELNDILKVVPAKKADMFFDNIKSIVSVSKGKERYNALIEDIENPFYANYVLYERFEEKGHVPFETDTSIKKAKKYLRNKYHSFKYSLSGTNTAEAKPEIPYTMQDEFYNIPFRNVEIPANYSLTLQTPEESILKTNLIELTEHIKTEELKRAIELKRHFKELRKQAKLKVISDVKDIISQKLSKKTLDKQEAMYEKKATKMRLSLLPEIFESIKITRETDRLAGWKESVSTKDAIKLYNRINGSNKKLVRYMLRKQQENGTGRVFSIKDIIKIIDETEQEIAAKKSIDKTFKPKSLYDEIYNRYFDKYGKLQSTPRKKRVSKIKKS